ncbi:DNA repair protein RAD51 homolog 4-like isoform X2 [Mercenaria mercenaria]|uniref:DNA repair protein RAD51 homolog 4-like isoform X2 n=1 Tax=Mercenaria mercenaria TaxID=6596 RepID=UPI00234E6AB5|nr:DNA repair protein RAD51 homolog 4-like isoform X2 [Mercenaria mercenaria]
MSLLKLGICPSLDEEVLEKLKSKNICRITEFICKDPEDIAQLTGVYYKDVVTIRNVILAKYSCISVNGCDFYNSVVESTTILSTGIKSLDNLLDGGLYTGDVTEIAGDIAVGKTQICLNVCAATAQQRNQTVVYIDTGAAFSASRVLQMVTDSSSEEILTRIQVYDAFTVHAVFDVIDSIECNIQTARDPFYNQLKLIIVDNIAAVVYPFLGGNSFSENQGLLSLLGQKMKSLAAVYSVAVLVTNNLVRGESGIKTASLGRLWSHIPHVRCVIADSDKYIDGRRNLTVVKNSRGVCNTCGQINIQENGPIT